MHTLICGVTESGKTTLAHKLADFDDRDKRRIIVFDPVLTETAFGEWPSRAEIFTDEQKFTRYLVKQAGADTCVYIDEGGDIFSHSQPENRWILTRGRHLGYSVTLICQRPKLVSPSVRHQTSRLFLFRLAESDLQAIAADYGHSKLNKISLDQGDFLVLHSGHAQIVRANVFELLHRQKGHEWNTILSPPLQPSSSSRSSGASTSSAKPSQGNRKPNPLAKVKPRTME
jgi:hypothetical protein